MRTTTEESIFCVCSRDCSRPFHTAYGERVKAEFTLPDGSTEAVFEDYDSDMRGVKRGDTVMLYRTQKGLKFAHVSERGAARRETAKAPGPARNEPANEADKKAIADYVKQQVAFFSFIAKQVSADKTLGTLTEEGKRAIITSLFIQSHKKFNI